MQKCEELERKNKLLSCKHEDLKQIESYFGQS
jgi:hypothetical protein